MKIKTISTKQILFAIAATAIGVIFAISFSTKSAELYPVVISTEPANGEISVLDRAVIKINFGQNIPQKQQSFVSFSLSPVTELSSSWTSASSILIKPVMLLPNIDYAGVVLFRNQLIYKFSFKTNKFSLNELKEQGFQQGKDDFIFGQKMQKLMEQYPWYEKMPIQSPSYTIVYDFEKEAFRIRITATPPLTDNQRKTIEQEALKALRDIGVNTTLQSYYVL